MQFDFSALDAELDSLGRPADDALALARSFAPETAPSPGARSAPLDDVDEALFALQNTAGEPPLAPLPAWKPSSVPPIASVAAVPPQSASTHTKRSSPATLTQSQEIVLPDPIAREELSLESVESGELRLDGDEPSSGSFELADEPTAPRIAREDRPPQPDSEANALAHFDEVQDALEGSQPILLSGTARPTPSPLGERDPDAEFDALLSEATDPRGIPTGAAGAASTNGEVDTDDLLRGLEGDELVSEADLADADDEPHEAELLTRSLFEEPVDSTEIIDRNAVFNPAIAQLDQPAEGEVMLDDELDSGELEIMMDDDEGAATMAPPPLQSSSKAPPPPPTGDKRPSSGLLGRLFSKRDGE